MAARQVSALAAGRRDADQKHGRPQRQRLVDAGHHRHVRVEAGMWSRTREPARVESITATTGSAP